MTNDVVEIKLAAGIRWAIALAVVIVAAWLGLVSFRWASAETIIYLAAKMPLPTRALEVAHSLAPSNPETCYVLGTVYLDGGAPDAVAAAHDLLGSAAATAPNRSRVWLAVGRERELAGDSTASEAAFRRAVELAPSHGSCAWALGNFYLRQDRMADASTWIRRAVLADPDLAPIAVRTMWMATDKDVAATVRAFDGASAATSATIALLLSEKRPDDALALWRATVSGTTSDPALQAQGKELAAALLASGRGAEYVGVLGSVDPTAVSELGVLGNPSFDAPISDRETSPFRWTVTQSNEARVSVDGGRNGGRALRVDYDSNGGSSFTHATELANLEPGARYTLKFWAMASDLRTGGGPTLRVTDAVDPNAALAVGFLPVGTADWTQGFLSFTAPPSGLVSIRIGREACGPVCPIFGTIRVDDITLTR